MKNYSYSRLAKEESSSPNQSFSSFKRKKDEYTSEYSSSLNKNEIIFEEDENDIIPQNIQKYGNIQIISNQRNNFNIIKSFKNLSNEHISNNFTQEITAKFPKLRIFNITKQKKIRPLEMRTMYIKSFLGKLQHFIIKLMQIYNSQKENGKDKILPVYEFQNCKIFIKYSAKEAYETFCLEKKTSEILKLNDKEGKNTNNIKIIDKIINAEGEKRNEDLIEVLDKSIKELMDIYRDKINPKKDFYKHFKRFQDYLNELKEKEDADPKQIKIIEEQGMNYEAILLNIINNDCKPGPKNKIKSK